MKMQITTLLGAQPPRRHLPVPLLPAHRTPAPRILWPRPSRHRSLPVLEKPAQAQCCSSVYRRRSLSQTSPGPCPKPALPQQRDAHGPAIPVCRHRGSCKAPGNKHNLLPPAGRVFMAPNPLSLSGLSQRERLPLSRSCILQWFEKKR